MAIFSLNQNLRPSPPIAPAVTMQKFRLVKNILPIMPDIIGITINFAV